MKATRRYNNHNRGDKPVFGFSEADKRILRDEDPSNGQKVQIFTEETEPLEEPTTAEEYTKVCPTCENYDLKYWQKINMYYCGTCGTRVDSDRGFENAKKITEDDEMYVPTAHLMYPTIGEAERDSTRPYFISFNPDKEQQENDGFEIVKQSADGRIQTRKVTDISKLGEALKF